MTIQTLIYKSIRQLEDRGVIPKFLWMSPLAHQWLVEEIKKECGEEHKRVFEISGLTVLIENECPAGTAYISGE